MRGNLTEWFLDKVKIGRGCIDAWDRDHYLFRSLDSLLIGLHLTQEDQCSPQYSNDNKKYPDVHDGMMPAEQTEHYSAAQNEPDDRFIGFRINRVHHLFLQKDK